MCSDPAHDKVLARLRSLGKSQRGSYRTGLVAKVTGYSRSTIWDRCELQLDHPDRIASSRQHTRAHRYIPHEEVVRLIRLQMALPEAS